MQGQRAAFELGDLSRLVLQIHSHHELGKVLAHQRLPFLQSNSSSQVRLYSLICLGILVTCCMYVCVL